MKTKKFLIFNQLFQRRVQVSYKEFLIKKMSVKKHTIDRNRSSADASQVFLDNMSTHCNCVCRLKKSIKLSNFIQSGTFYGLFDFLLLIFVQAIAKIGCFDSPDGQLIRNCSIFAQNLRLKTKQPKINVGTSKNIPLVLKTRSISNERPTSLLSANCRLTASPGRQSEYYLFAVITRLKRAKALQ